MPKFPEPPSVDELKDVPPDNHTLSEGTRLVRVYRRGGDHPSSWDDFRYYGPVEARFDHHPKPAQVHSDYSIFYAAESVVTTLAEVFQETRTIHTRRDDPALAVFELTRDVPLLNLRDTWPTRAGASMKLNSGPRPRARRWSRVIYRAYPDLEGIYYSSSMHAHEPSVALYGRGEDALPDTPTFDCLLRDANLLGDLKRAAEEIGYDLMH